MSGPIRLAAAVAALLLFGCAGSAGRAQTRDTAVLDVSCPVADAVLWVDDRYVAQVRDLAAGLALSPGRHQIELRHDNYHPYYGEIDLAAGERLHLDLELAEALP